MTTTTLVLSIALCYLFTIHLTPVDSTKLTYYWIVHEKEFKPLGSDAQLATCDGKVLARTSKAFADRIAVEGSGYLKDGKTVLNLGSCISDRNTCRPQKGNKYNCFEKVKSPLGSHDNPLVPFVSIASNDISYGTTGIITQLKGKKLPSGQVHDGCVRVDDSCSTCNHPNWIDFYVVSESNYKKVNTQLRLSEVNFQRTKCSPKKYKS